MPSQSFCGSSLLENSMHSSRADFSSLQTQQGYILSQMCQLLLFLKGFSMWMCSEAVDEERNSGYG